MEDIQDKGTYRVQIQGGRLDGEGFEVGDGGLTAGRSMDCDIVLEDRSISRRHLRFYLKDGYCYVQDMGSRNGFLVQGKRTQHQCLRDGDVVDVGYCKFLFHSEGSWKDRETAAEIVDQVQELEEDAKRPREYIKAPPHPYAAAALVFAALAFWFWAFALGAAVLAVVALVDIRRKARHRGVPLAGGALLLAALAVALNAWLKGADLPYNADAAAKACRENLMRIGEALNRYTADNDGRYPLSLEALYPDHVRRKERLWCPAAPGAQEIGRGYLFAAAGAEKLPPQAVVLCDASPENHGRTGGFVLRANGEIQWLPAKDLELLLMDLRGR